MGHISRLPREIRDQILSYLNFRELQNAHHAGPPFYVDTHRKIGLVLLREEYKLQEAFMKLSLFGRLPWNRLNWDSVFSEPPPQGIVNVLLEIHGRSYSGWRRLMPRNIRITEDWIKCAQQVHDIPRDLAESALRPYEASMPCMVCLEMTSMARFPYTDFQPFDTRYHEAFLTGSDIYRWRNDLTEAQITHWDSYENLSIVLQHRCCIDCIQLDLSYQPAWIALGPFGETVSIRCSCSRIDECDIFDGLSLQNCDEKVCRTCYQERHRDISAITDAMERDSTQINETTTDANRWCQRLTLPWVYWGLVL